jgi:hypothetical protein
VVVFPKTAETVDEKMLVEGAIVTVEGRVIKEYYGDDDEPRVKLVHMAIEGPAREFEYEGIHPIVVELREMPDEVTMALLYDKITVRGTSNVYLKLNESGHDIAVKLNNQTTAGNEHAIRAILKDYIRK